MNGKRAKLLRLVAQKQTVGRPEVEYGHTKLASKKEGYMTVYTRTLTPKCTRGVYQKAKEGYKRLRRRGLKPAPQNPMQRAKVERLFRLRMPRTA